MRVYLTPPQPSRGLDRIAHALRRYAPASVEVCEFPRNVDLTVIYAIGRRDHIERQCVDIWRQGKKYVIVQVCLRSTMSPRVDDWLQASDVGLYSEGFEGIWLNSHVIWSYYDLDQACVDDGWSLEHDGDSMFDRDQFYHAPLGADPDVFYPRDMPKQYTIATSGYNRLQESIRECALAAGAVNGMVFHLGETRNWYDNIIYANGIDDLQLATRYSMCQFVSGLRRTEGFELPAVEGLLCGARPIVFDTPDYRWNYHEFAEYVHEGSRAEVVEQLVELFKRGARPVGDAELAEARHWFNWERICGEFWNRCLQ